MSMPAVLEIKNGTPVQGTFSDAEMAGRATRLHQIMAAQNIDVALFTSYHNIDRSE